MNRLVKLVLHAGLVLMIGFVLSPLAQAFAADITVDETAGCTLNGAIKSANGETSG